MFRACDALFDNSHHDVSGAVLRLDFQLLLFLFLLLDLVGLSKQLF